MNQGRVANQYYDRITMIPKKSTDKSAGFVKGRFLVPMKSLEATSGSE